MSIEQKRVATNLSRKSLGRVMILERRIRSTNIIWNRLGRSLERTAISQILENAEQGQNGMHVIFDLPGEARPTRTRDYDLRDVDMFSEDIAGGWRIKDVDGERREQVVRDV